MRRIFKRRFSLMEVAGLLSVLLVGIGLYAWAATTVPNTFTSGTTAKADDVNANFQALATAIDTKSIFTYCAGNNANDIMVKVGPLCVDKYEASVWSNADGSGTQYGATGTSFYLTAYPGGFPANGNWTTPVYAVSKAGVIPSTSLTWYQAQQACALSGKRLLTNAEWQMAAAGTPDPGTDNGSTDCNVDTRAPVETGSRDSCVSNWGVNDMVGNVWEFVADWIQGDSNPWSAFVTTRTAGAGYGGDRIAGINPAQYQASDSTNLPAAIIRGGYFVGGPIVGVFAMAAGTAPSVAVYSTGFRCAR
jgi:formylglycine-generating enzyme required for sulfatase activity